jgi:hypothetical protein
MPRSHCTNGLAVLFTVLGACAKEAPVVEVKGECAAAYQGQVCTWARMQESTVVAVGLTVPIASIENAPGDQPMVWPPPRIAALRMPESARPQAGLTELTMFWEAHGHPPGPYLTPHFDFHFFVIPPGERSAIDCADKTKPSVLPEGYSMPDVTLPPALAAMAGESPLIGLCVAQMGMHSLLTAELESTETFRGSMVIGFYHGRPIFIEPMLSRSILMEKRSFDLPIPGIPGMTGTYPRTFQAEFDSQQQAYHFVFSDFSPDA